MRLHELEQGETFFQRLLFKFISLMSGMRLPDAARIVFYHKEFYGDIMSLWTHAAMRGESVWSVGERELMATMTAKWNTCTFCVDAHSAIASLQLGKPMVESAIENFRQAKLSEKLNTTLTFLEILTKSPDELTVDDAQTVINKSVTLEALEDAIAVTTLFNITVRCANTLKFELLNDADLNRAAKRMLTQGYAFGKSKTPPRPDHNALAVVLHQRVFEGPGVTNKALRQAIGSRANGGPPVEAAYDELALRIGEDSYKVTDEQVKMLVEKAGSERAAFELIAAAAVSAGLYRWRKGLRVLKEVK